MYLIVLAVLGGIVVFCVIVTLCQFLRRPRAISKPDIAILDHRDVGRVPLNSEIDVFWQDIDASRKSVRAQGIEMSENGASIRSPKPIECNSVVYLKARQVHFEGNAVVRRCTKKGFRYIIGLELQRPKTQTTDLSVSA